MTHPLDQSIRQVRMSLAAKALLDRVKAQGGAAYSINYPVIYGNRSTGVEAQRAWRAADELRKLGLVTLTGSRQSWAAELLPGLKPSIEVRVPAAPLPRPADVPADVVQRTVTPANPYAPTYHNGTHNAVTVRDRGRIAGIVFEYLTDGSFGWQDADLATCADRYPSALDAAADLLASHRQSVHDTEPGRLAAELVHPGTHEFTPVHDEGTLLGWTFRSAEYPRPHHWVTARGAVGLRKFDGAPAAAADLRTRHAEPLADDGQAIQLYRNSRTGSTSAAHNAVRVYEDGGNGELLGWTVDVVITDRRDGRNSRVAYAWVSATRRVHGAGSFTVVPLFKSREEAAAALALDRSLDWAVVPASGS
ncbi:hypothetical protein ACFYNO_14440 [Kitasatospora sp. NPDC006697]|uniref:hypothetical protein n=1 Tax=unclassified Kitasatospora TaxID=2633591 RepID=UPI0036C8B667